MFRVEQVTADNIVAQVMAALRIVRRNVGLELSRTAAGP